MIGWAVVLAAHFTGIKRLNAVTFTTLFLAVIFGLGCTMAAIQALRDMQREALSLGESLADCLRAVDRQLLNCRLLASALAIGFAGDVVLTFVHYATGNLPLRGLVASLILVAAFAAGIAATLRKYYRETLLPRRHELQTASGEL